MKKLLSILLCAAILASLTPSVFAATQTYANTFSDYTWTFSEEEDVNKYVYLNNNSTSTAELVTDTTLPGSPEGNKVLKVDKPTGGSNINFNPLTHTAGITVSEVKVAFDVKTSSTFRFILRNTGDYNAVEWSGGKITFLGQSNVGTYTMGEWYNVELLFNISKGYGQLKMKKAGTTAWTTYIALAGAGELSGWTSTSRLGMGVLNDCTVYVDNYYQNEVSVPAAFLGSDDFTDGINGWAQTNVNAHVTAGTYDLNGNTVLKIGANEGETISGSNTNLSKAIPEFAASDNTNYYFKFKFGGKSQSGSFGASLATEEGTATYKELAIVKVAAGDVRVFGGITATKDGTSIGSSFGQVSENTLYDAEAVYNPSTGTLTSVLTNADGKQFINTIADGSLAGRPTKFAFRNSSLSTETPVSVGYFDDFETDILDSNGPAFVDSKILSGNAEKASLDETAVFTYDRTINQAELASAKVTLNSEELSPEDYTITSKGNEVYVTLKNLTTDTYYKVTLEKVTDIVGVANENAEEISFRTSDVAIKAEKPELVGTKLTSNVTSYYANGKTIKFILAIYNDTETMIEAVKVIDVTVSDRNGKVEEADFTEILANAAGKKVKGFVWDSFGTMEPYALSYEGTYNN